MSFLKGLAGFLMYLELDAREKYQQGILKRSRHQKLYWEISENHRMLAKA